MLIVDCLSTDRTIDTYRPQTMLIVDCLSTDRSNYKQRRWRRTTVVVVDGW